MKYSVAQLENIVNTARSLVDRLEDEIDVQYRLENIKPTNEFGASERRVDLGSEFNDPGLGRVMEYLTDMEEISQITVSDRFKELRAKELGIVDGGRRICTRHDFWRADTEDTQTCPQGEREWENDQTDLISLLTEAGIDGWTEEDEVAAAGKPNLNGDNEPGY